MGLLFQYFSAVASRIIFIAHAVYSLYVIVHRFSHAESNMSYEVYWSIMAIPALILAEGIYTVYKRKGQEYEIFWPSGFLYVVTMIAITWMLEINLLDEEEMCLVLSANTQQNYTNEKLLQGTRGLCYLVSLTNKNDQKIRASIEIGMLGALVLGRWLLPRGELTRDQLSALLLMFISNGADVIEFLNTWHEFPDLRKRSVTYTVLALYSWSLLQFAVVSTKTTEEYEEKMEEESIAITSDRHQSENKNGRKETSFPGIDPTLPRYIQKLLKKNMKKNKRNILRSKPRISSNTSFISVSSSRSRPRVQSTATIDSVFIPPDKNRDSNDSTISVANFSDVFTVTEREFQPRNRRVTVRFAETKGNTSSQSRYKQTTDYLQTLALEDRWDEFSDAIKKARTRGFSTATFASEEEYTENESETKENKYFKLFREHFDPEMYQIIISLLCLELPYFIARVAFSVKYNVSSSSMVFYTIKNMFMIVFLIYRFWVVLTNRSEEIEVQD